MAVLYWVDAHPGVFAGVFLAVRAIPVVVGWDVVWLRVGRMIKRPPRRQVNRSVTGVLSVRLFDLVLVVAAVVLDPGLSWTDLGFREPHSSDAALILLEISLVPMVAVVGAHFAVRRRVQEPRPGSDRGRPRFVDYF